MRLHYRIDGAESAPVVVLSGSLGSTLEMWDRQLPALLERFRVLRYDHPGHGRSPLADLRGIESLARGVVDLLDELELERVSWCGLSLGGAVGMRLALDVSERLDRLVLACTAARFGDPATWAERAAAVRAGGMETVVDAVSERWFTPASPNVGTFRAMLLSTPPEGYARCCEAIRDWDVRGELHAVRAPTLAIAAADDPSTPPEYLEQVAGEVPGARLEVVADARHLVNVERADTFNDLLLGHLA